MTITVGLAGITGKFGRLLASKLLQKPDVLLRGYCRDPKKVIAPIASSSQVQLFQGEAYDDDKIRSFVKGCDVVVCAYLGDGKLMVDGQKKLIDGCEAEAVPRFVASDWSLDYTKLELGEFFAKEPMQHVKAHLEAQKNVKGVHILIGAFMEVIFGPFFQAFDPASKTFKYWGDGTEAWEGTTYENAAEYTAAIVTDPSATGIQKFVGDRKNVNEIAATFQKVYGVEPKLERQGSFEDLKAKMYSVRAENPSEWYKYLPMFYTYYWGISRTNVGSDFDNTKYPGVKPFTWEDFMRTRSIEQLSGGVN